MDIYTGMPYTNSAMNPKHEEYDEEMGRTDFPYSDNGDHEVMTIPIRPRPRVEPNNSGLVYVSPPYPGHVGYSHHQPHPYNNYNSNATLSSHVNFDSMSKVKVKGHHSKRDVHMDAMAKQCAVAMGIVFLLALVAAIFSAIYFSYKTENPKD